MLKSMVIAGEGTKFLSTSQVLNARKNRECIRVGSRTIVRGELFIFGHGGQIVIGNDCYIGENSKIWSSLEINIGDNVLIAHNVNIHDNNSHPIDFMERQQHYKDIYKSGHPKEVNIKEKSVIIENDVWIGFNSVVLKGVTIGRGAIIAAGSIVTKDVAPFTVVAGNPAVVVKHLK